MFLERLFYLCLLATLALAFTEDSGQVCTEQAEELTEGSLELSLLQTGILVDRRGVKVTQHDPTASAILKNKIVGPTDVQLELQDVLADACSDASKYSSHGTTSPSFLKLPGSDEVISVFRGLCLGFPGVYHTWTSYVVLATTQIGELHSGRAALNWTTFDRVPNPLVMDLKTLPNGAELKECLHPERPGAAWIEGPEDPKLFMSNGKTYLMYIGVSIEPATSDASKSGQANIAAGRPPCGPYNFHPHVRELVSLPPHIRFGPVVPLVVEGMHVDEKNWGTFNYQVNSSVPEQLLMVYDMHPHTILQIDLATGHGQRLYNETSSLLDSLALDSGAESSDFHCNGNHAVPVKCSDGTACHLSIFHQHVDEGFHRTYRHWPYKFSAEPPFEIRQLGKQLPLKSAPQPIVPTWRVQFVTSLILDAGHVIIGYNTGDEHSNAFRMPYDEFESQFF